MDSRPLKCVGTQLQIMRIKLNCDMRTTLFYCGLRQVRLQSSITRRPSKPSVQISGSKHNQFYKWLAVPGLQSQIYQKV